MEDLSNYQQAVITQVQANGSYNSQYGLMYVQEVVLNDGRVGQVSAKQPDKWKQGQRVVVKGATPTNYGLKFQLASAMSLPDSQGLIQPGRPELKRELTTSQRIDGAWAIGQAIALGYNDSEAILDQARKLLVIKDKLLAEIKQQDKIKAEQASGHNNLPPEMQAPQGYAQAPQPFQPAQGTLPPVPQGAPSYVTPQPAQAPQGYEDEPPF